VHLHAFLDSHPLEESANIQAWQFSCGSSINVVRRPTCACGPIISDLWIYLNTSGPGARNPRPLNLVCDLFSNKMKARFTGCFAMEILINVVFEGLWKKFATQSGNYRIRRKLATRDTSTHHCECCNHFHV
jgi:hypothetical protein